MSMNESIVSLTLSTLDGVTRNRLSKKALAKFKQMLIRNEFLDHLDISAVNLGNEGIA